MKNESGKTTILSLFAFIIIGYIVYCGFILISSKVKSDNAQKDIIDSIMRLRVNDDLPAKATSIIVKKLEGSSYIFDNDDRRSIEVYIDKQKRTIDIYFSYSYEMDFLLFKQVKLVEVEESSSSDRWN